VERFELGGLQYPPAERCDCNSSVTSCMMPQKTKRTLASSSGSLQKSPFIGTRERSRKGPYSLNRPALDSGGFSVHAGRGPRIVATDPQTAARSGEYPSYWTVPHGWIQNDSELPKTCRLVCGSLTVAVDRPQAWRSLVAIPGMEEAHGRDRAAQGHWAFSAGRWLGR